MGGVAATLDDIPKPIWILGMVLAFIWCWPVGLAILAVFLFGRSGRMGPWRYAHGCWGTWYHPEGWRNGTTANGNGNGASATRSGGCFWGRAPSSGNRAFDEYRAETLRRLEDEQRDFKAFLDRLRMAKDKAEFDQFMAERRNRPESPPQS